MTFQRNPEPLDAFDAVLMGDLSWIASATPASPFLHLLDRYREE
jgi:hypothetical protein